MSFIGLLQKSEKTQSGRQQTVYRVFPIKRINLLEMQNIDFIVLDKNVHDDTVFGGNLRAILQSVIYLTEISV